MLLDNKNKKENTDVTSLTQLAYKLIKEQLVSGQLKQGEVISISAMAKKLNISRTPVTYACQKLESDKFLNIVPKQGVIVKTITINDAREIYELRAAIESYAAKRGFANITENDINYLEDSYSKQVQAVGENDIYSFMLEDINFHKYLLTKYENSQFFSIVNNLFDRAFLLGVESCKNPLRLAESIKEHHRIIDCILRKDKTGFVDEVERNILNGYTSLTGAYMKDFHNLENLE
ncbi:MAG: transcriptional regulator, GntR family with sensor domain containing protein [Firmicutes bacterium]|nr:transcriptional regulator, GntR family with sensor domain containing protein [Bacillota bacterium]